MSLEQFAVSLPASQDCSVESAADLVEINYHIAEAEEVGDKAKAFFETCFRRENDLAILGVQKTPHPCCAVPQRFSVKWLTILCMYF
jgi:hypothetical protein